MNSIFNRQNFGLLFSSIGIVLISSVIGYSLLYTIFLIPNHKIINNVSKSTNTFEFEKTYPKLFKFQTSKLDNFTDALMLLNASYNGKESELDKTLKIFRLEAKNNHGKVLNPCQTLVSYHNKNKSADITFNNASYARYWHGYLSYLRPALYLTNYDNIRIINFICQIFLVVAICMTLYVKNCKNIIIPYILSVLSLCPFAVSKSLQYSSVYYIFTISILYLLFKYKKWNRLNEYCYFFTCIGAATSYFDFLTYPITTLGMPIVLLMSLKIKDDYQLLLKIFAYSTIFWSIGYFGMWSMKWLLATLFTDYNVIFDAINAIRYRSSMTDGDNNSISYLKLFRRSFTIFSRGPIMIAIYIYLFVRIKKYLSLDKKWIAKSLRIYLPCMVYRFYGIR